MNFKPRNLRSPASAGTSNTRNAETGFIRLKALLCSLFAFAAIFSAFAIGPQWWQDRGVVSTSANTVTNDFAPATLGQLKWIAKRAAEELDENLPGGSGAAVSNLVNGFVDTNNYLVANIGQAKNVATFFYDRLIEVGYTNVYPWIDATNTANDFSPINIGQLKTLFAFNPGLDTDDDELPDWWEMTQFGSLGESGDGDVDDDGILNAQEYAAQSDPNGLDIIDLSPSMTSNQVKNAEVVRQKAGFWGFYEENFYRRREHSHQGHDEIIIDPTGSGDPYGGWEETQTSSSYHLEYDLEAAAPSSGSLSHSYYRYLTTFDIYANDSYWEYDLSGESWSTCGSNCFNSTSENSTGYYFTTNDCGAGAIDRGMKVHHSLTNNSDSQQVPITNLDCNENVTLSLVYDDDLLCETASNNLKSVASWSSIDWGKTRKKTYVMKTACDQTNITECTYDGATLNAKKDIYRNNTVNRDEIHLRDFRFSVFAEPDAPSPGTTYRAWYLKYKKVYADTNTTLIGGYKFTGQEAGGNAVLLSPEYVDVGHPGEDGEIWVTRAMVDLPHNPYLPWQQGGTYDVAAHTTAYGVSLTNFLWTLHTIEGSESASIDTNGVLHFGLGGGKYRITIKWTLPDDNIMLDVGVVNVVKVKEVSVHRNDKETFQIPSVLSTGMLHFVCVKDTGPIDLVAIIEPASAVTNVQWSIENEQITTLLGCALGSTVARIKDSSTAKEISSRIKLNTTTLWEGRTWIVWATLSARHDNQYTEFHGNNHMSLGDALWDEVLMLGISKNATYGATYYNAAIEWKHEITPSSIISSIDRPDLSTRWQAVREMKQRCWVDHVLMDTDVAYDQARLIMYWKSDDERDNDEDLNPYEGPRANTNGPATCDLFSCDNVKFDRGAIVHRDMFWATSNLVRKCIFREWTAVRLDDSKLARCSEKRDWRAYRAVVYDSLTDQWNSDPNPMRLNTVDESHADFTNE